jgi:Mn-dependent DtxR family transcriptional regulator
MAKQPPPSRSAERLKQYLECMQTAITENGFATDYDLLKETMNVAQRERAINYMLKNRLIQEVEGGYNLTQEGTYLLDVLRNRKATGILTRELSGDKIRPYL